MTLEERAKEIADEANQCCLRSDGYLEEIEALALRHLQAAVAEERESCAQTVIEAEAKMSGMDLELLHVGEHLAAAIRARGSP